MRVCKQVGPPTLNSSLRDFPNRDSSMVAVFTRSDESALLQLPHQADDARQLPHDRLSHHSCHCHHHRYDHRSVRQFMRTSQVAYPCDFTVAYLRSECLSPIAHVPRVLLCCLIAIAGFVLLEVYKYIKGCQEGAHRYGRSPPWHSAL